MQLLVYKKSSVKVNVEVNCSIHSKHEELLFLCEIIPRKLGQAWVSYFRIHFDVRWKEDYHEQKYIKNVNV